MKRVVIFDFDGTVVDTITDVGLCFNEALRLNNFPQHGLEKFSRFVGGNLETVVSRMLPQDQVTEENIFQVKTVYRQLYMSSEKPNTKPYPGMMQVMDDLKSLGWLLTINSNKGQILLDDMVNKSFPLGYFSAVVGFDESRPSKPDPYGVEMIRRICECESQDVIYVGDGRSDIETAVNANIPCVFVRWGQGTQDDWKDPRVFARVENAQQLYDVLLSWGSVADD